MNELKLHDLRSKAQELAREKFPADGPLMNLSLDPDNNSDDAIYIDRVHASYKFLAELIVRECMRKVAGYLLEDEFGNQDVKEASEELAKHFGVE